MDPKSTQRFFHVRSGTAFNSRPRILVTPDAIAAGPESEAEYRLRSNYITAVIEAGGLPFIAPHEPSSLQDMTECADGILVTGTLPGIQATKQRLEFEEQLVRVALQRNIPTLGICHGMQLIGKCLGGRLIEQMPSSLGRRVDHNPQPIPDQTAHLITLEPHSILNPTADTVDVQVNSSHGHMLAGPGSFRVIANAPDGVIEAISGKSTFFCIGVQWHPEYQLSGLDRHILEHFISASTAFARSQNAQR